MFCLCTFSSTVSIDGRMRSSRSLCWRSWAALGAYVGCLGAYVGGLGSGAGPKLAVLGRSWGLCWLSWGLCWRSWAALRAYVGGLGSGSGPKLAVLGPKWSVLEAIRAKSGPNPSGKAIWQADQGGKVAQTRAGRRSGLRGTPGSTGAREASYRIFSVDMPVCVSMFYYKLPCVVAYVPTCLLCCAFCTVFL